MELVSRSMCEVSYDFTVFTIFTIFNENFKLKTEFLCKVLELQRKKIKGGILALERHRHHHHQTSLTRRHVIPIRSFHSTPELDVIIISK